MIESIHQIHGWKNVTLLPTVGNNILPWFWILIRYRLKIQVFKRLNYQTSSCGLAHTEVRRAMWKCWFLQLAISRRSAYNLSFTMTCSRDTVHCLMKRYIESGFMSISWNTCLFIGRSHDTVSGKTSLPVNKSTLRGFAWATFTIGMCTAQSESSHRGNSRPSMTYWELVLYQQISLAKLYNNVLVLCDDYLICLTLPLRRSRKNFLCWGVSSWVISEVDYGCAIRLSV